MKTAVPDPREAIDYSESIQDFVSRDPFQKNLKSEEGHVDWLETQLGLIDKMAL